MTMQSPTAQPGLLRPARDIPLSGVGAELVRLYSQNEEFRTEIARLRDRLDGANQRARSAESREGHRERERDGARSDLMAFQKLVDSRMTSDEFGSLWCDECGENLCEVGSNLCDIHSPSEPDYDIATSNQRQSDFYQRVGGRDE